MNREQIDARTLDVIEMCFHRRKLSVPWRAKMTNREQIDARTLDVIEKIKKQEKIWTA